MNAHTEHEKFPVDDCVTCLTYKLGRIGKELIRCLEMCVAKDDEIAALKAELQAAKETLANWSHTASLAVEKWIPLGENGPAFRSVVAKLDDAKEKLQSAKAFHLHCCEIVGLGHDEEDWTRDLACVEERLRLIALARNKAEAARDAALAQLAECQVKIDMPGGYCTCGTLNNPDGTCPLETEEDKINPLCGRCCKDFDNHFYDTRQCWTHGEDKFRHIGARP